MMNCKKLLVALMLLVVTLASKAQTSSPIYYGLSGLIVGPDGSLFNGTLSVELARPSAANLCTSPISIVARQTAILKITNGNIVNGASARFLTNSCMSPNIPYYAQMFDSKNALVYADNWYLPGSISSLIDMGSIHDVGIQTGGTNSTMTPIVVALPYAIVSNPVGSQTVTQPGGTFLNVNNLNVTGVFTLAGSSVGGGLNFQASTPATAGHPVNSPSLTMGGNTWTGSASVASPWITKDVEAFNFTTYSSTLTFQYTGPNTTYGIYFPGANLSLGTFLSLYEGTILYEGGATSPVGNFCTTGSVYAEWNPPPSDRTPLSVCGGDHAYHHLGSQSTEGIPGSTLDATATLNVVALTGSVSSSTWPAGIPGFVSAVIICEPSGGGDTYAWPSNVVGGMTINTSANKCNAQDFAYSTSFSMWMATNAGTTY